jgi:RNase P protein component
MWDQVSNVRPGLRVVVRALPAAASATSIELEADIAKALKRLGVTQGVSAHG